MPVKLEPLVQEPPVPQAQQDHRDLLEPQEIKVPPVHRALKEPLVYKDCLAPQDPLDHKDPLEPLDWQGHKDPLEPLDSLVRPEQVPLEPLDHKDLKDPPVLADCKVPLVPAD